MRGLWQPSPHPPGSEPAPGKRAPHSGQGRPAEGEPAAEEGPRATKRRISSHAKLSNPPLPENPWGHADTEVRHCSLSAPRARDPRAEPGRLRGERYEGGEDGGTGVRCMAGVSVGTAVGMSEEMGGSHPAA